MYHNGKCFSALVCASNVSLCVFVSSSAVWTKGPSLGFSDRASAADQPSVWPSGHAGSSLDGETWFWKAQILCTSRERYRLHTSNVLYYVHIEVFSKMMDVFLCPVVHVCVDLLSLDQSKTFYKPDWFDIVGAEVKCCKEAVCVIDMSSFTKFELTVSLDALEGFKPLWIT